MFIYFLFFYLINLFILRFVDVARQKDIDSNSYSLKMIKIYKCPPLEYIPLHLFT